MSNKTKPKPRVMWANYYESGINGVWRKKTTALIAEDAATIPVAVIPLDDVEAIVERAATAFLDHDSASCPLNYGRIRAALTAAGIPCTKRRARK